MLTEKPLDKGDVRSFYLISGEEVIAEVLSVSDTNVVLSKPTKLILTEQGPGLFPMSFAGPQFEGPTPDYTVDYTATFEWSKILTVLKCSDRMMNEYKNLTSSIQIASAGSVKV